MTKLKVRGHFKNDYTLSNPMARKVVTFMKPSFRMVHITSYISIFPYTERRFIDI